MYSRITCFDADFVFVIEVIKYYSNQTIKSTNLEVFTVILNFKEILKFIFLLLEKA